MKGTQKLWRGLKRASPTILSCMAAVGVVATAVTAAKATTKARKLLEEETAQKGRELTTKEVVQAAAPVYIPTVVVAASTIACLFGANVLNKRQQASMVSAYGLLNQTYQRYRKAANTVYGEDADSKIKAEMAKEVYISGDGTIYSPDQDKVSEKILFYDVNSQRYFHATTPAVLAAMYHLNRNLVLRGYVSVNEFFDFLGVEKTDGGDEIGWYIDEMMESGLMWLDFENCYTKMEDGMECCVISTIISPYPLGEYISL